jgi:hypothetical protein
MHYPFSFPINVGNTSLPYDIGARALIQRDADGDLVVAEVELEDFVKVKVADTDGDFYYRTEWVPLPSDHYLRAPMIDYLGGCEREIAAMSGERDVKAEATDAWLDDAKHAA